MYRTKIDFINDWAHASSGTLRIMRALTDDKLNQAIADGHNSLGWLGWHLVTSAAGLSSLTGIQVQSPGNAKEVPNRASDIADAYEKVAEEIKNSAEALFTDEMMAETVNAFGQPMPRGALLRMVIDHQTHHRGQMTVLLRQAGLPVPGVMGPTKEESQSHK